MSVHTDHILTVGQLEAWCKTRDGAELVYITVTLDSDGFGARAARRRMHANIQLGVMLTTSSVPDGGELFAVDPEQPA
jgi:hypothetical protein